MSGQGRKTGCFRFADLVLDLGQRTVTRSGESIRVSKLTFDVLSVLVQRAPNVVTHEELARLVWPGRVVTPENMTQRMSLLRQALGDTASHPRYVRVVRGQGYQLIPPVVVVPVDEVTRFRMPRRVTAGVSVSVVIVIALAVLFGDGPITTRRLMDSAAVVEEAVASEVASARFGSAQQRWRVDLAQDPANLNSLVGLGALLCESGEFNEGLGHLRKARDLYPDSIVILEALARCLVASSDYDGVAEAIALGVALDPQFPLRASPVNPGFEEGMYGWSLAYDRGFRAGLNHNFDFTIDSGVARSGHASGRLRSAIEGGQSTTMSTFVPVGFLGTKVRMSAYLKTEQVDKEAHLWLRVDSVSAGGIDTTFFVNTANDPLIRGTTGWTRYQIVADVPETAAYVHYGYGLSGTGTAWIDDVQFESVPASTPSTASRLPERLVLQRPENLDFAQGLDGWGVHGPSDIEGHTGSVRARDGMAEIQLYRSQRQIRQDVLVGDLAGRRVRMSTRLKRETNDDSLQASVQLGTANFSAGVPPLANRRITSGDSWVSVDLVIDVPETSTKIMYWISAAGKGRLLVDAVRLEAVDESVRLTTMPTR
jgi:DNA-binding winged helix-turn-helix (wHTH) protein/tetratricopeptide (TPR) repeat protein